MPYSYLVMVLYGAGVGETPLGAPIGFARAIAHTAKKIASVKDLLALEEQMREKHPQFPNAAIVSYQEIGNEFS